MKRILGIDHGRKRLGLALSDPTGLIATPYKTLDASRLGPLLQEIQSILTEYQITTVVLGLPLNADGSEGPQAQQVRKFAAHLKSQEVHFQNEHLSTHEAMQRGATRSNKDAYAAALILQAYLDERRNPRS